MQLSRLGSELVFHGAGLKIRVQDSGFRVQVSGSGVCGLGCRVLDITRCRASVVHGKDLEKLGPRFLGLAVGRWGVAVQGVGSSGAFREEITEWTLWCSGFRSLCLSFEGIFLVSSCVDGWLEVGDLGAHDLRKLGF